MGISQKVLFDRSRRIKRCPLFWYHYKTFIDPCGGGKSMNNKCKGTTRTFIAFWIISVHSRFALDHVQLQSIVWHEDASTIYIYGDEYIYKYIYIYIYIYPSPMRKPLQDCGRNQSDELDKKSAPRLFVQRLFRLTTCLKGTHLWADGFPSQRISNTGSILPSSRLPLQQASIASKAH